MKTKPHALLLVVTVATTVLLACFSGCGGGGGASSAGQSRSKTSSAEPGSPAEKARHVKEKARFIKRGNAICRRADAEQRRLARRYRKEMAPLDRRWELVDPAVVLAMEKELRELRALNPPRGDGAKVQRILEEMEKGIKDADYDPIDLIYTWSDPFQKARWLARKYGLTVCAFSSQVLIQPREEDTGF